MLLVLLSCTPLRNLCARRVELTGVLCPCMQHSICDRYAADN